MFLFLPYNKRLYSLNVYITNDNADIINSKKICVRLSFDSGEAAIYKDTLCISIDTPSIDLNSWRTTAQAPVFYVPNFKKNKKLFTESFNLEILIDFEHKDKQNQMKTLHESHLSISSLLLTKAGNIKAENVVVPLKVSDFVEDLSLTVTTSTLGMISNYTFTLLPYQRSFECFNHTKHFVGKQDVNEVLIIDRTKDLWEALRQQVYILFSSFSFYKWYSILWLFLLVLLLCLFHPKLRYVVSLCSCWYRELVILVSVLLFIFSWWLLQGYMVSYVWYGVLGVFCIPSSCYYLWGGTETFLDRLKVLIGIIFAIALLPLLVLAYMYNNFNLIHWVK
jgi:hypothetical protein